MNVEDLFRAELLKIIPYSCARDEAKINPLISLDANENSFGPFANPRINLPINRYPDSKQITLREKFSEVVGLGRENILVSNGSDEAIDLIIRAFCRPCRDGVLINTPTYGMYEVSARINQCTVYSVPLDQKFEIDPEQILANLNDNCKIIFVCSPNNPTGNTSPRRKIVELLRSFRGIVVIDEAYINFSDESSTTDLIRQYPNLIVLQTMSKYWGLAGARVGYVLADQRIISYLGRIKPPYNVSALSQTLAIDTLNREDQVRAAQSVICSERLRVSSYLKSLPIVEYVFPSETNFLLVRFLDSLQVMRAFESAGILVRYRGSVPRLEQCLRITIGTTAQNSSLIETIDKLLGRAVANENKRGAYYQRTTSETSIRIGLELERDSAAIVNTGIGFLNHMLELFAFHSGANLEISAVGDLQVDYHHTIEDLGLSLGYAIRSTLNSGRGIKRYGAYIPMDEANSRVLIDLSGRPRLEWSVKFIGDEIGGIATPMFKHFFESFSNALGATLHITANGAEDHHIIEGVFKGVARALREAWQTGISDEIQSSKGVL